MACRNLEESCHGLLLELRKMISEHFTQQLPLLVTADGSVECQDSPHLQESIVAPLHYAEVFTALQILSPCGTFVIKMFTLFEHSSVCLMYLLCCLFTEVSVFKPATSKGGNSEVYVICRQYSGFSEWKKVENVFRKQFPFSQINDVAMLDYPDIPEDFLECHLECCKYFFTLQTCNIKRNIYYYENKSHKQEIIELKKQVTQAFFDNCSINPIKKEDFVVKSGILQTSVKSHVKNYPKLSGSFSKRCNGVKSEGVVLQQQVKQQDLKLITKPSKKFWWNASHCVRGTVITDINSSLFCNTDVISLYKRTVPETYHSTPETKTQQHPETLPSGLLHPTLLSILTSTTTTSVIQLDHQQPSLSFYDDWFSTIIQSPITVLPTTTAQPSSADLIFVNLSSSTTCLWPELESNKYLLQLIVASTSTLNQDGTLVLLLPSSLTRYSSGLLYLLTTHFKESWLDCLTPTDIPPAIIFVATKFKVKEGFRRNLRLLCEKKNEGENIVELFPVTKLLFPEATLRSELARCNQQCLRHHINLYNNL